MPPWARASAVTHAAVMPRAPPLTRYTAREGGSVIAALRDGDRGAPVGAVADLGERLAAAGPSGSRPDVVIEAAGLAVTAQAAIRAVGKGGVVNLFAGCAREAEVVLDAQRLHYEEITVTSTFHHTPRSFRQALALLTERRVRAEDLVTGTASLDDVPDVLRRMAGGGDGLKTAILPWGPG